MIRKLTLTIVAIAFIFLAMTAQNCPTPHQFSVANLTDSSATLQWYLPTATGTPTHYIYILKNAAGVTLRTDSNLVAPGMSYNITALSPNTTYTVDLQADCNQSGDGISNVASFTFTTACSSQSAPYTEDFSLGIPQCSYSNHATIATGGRSGNCLTLTNSADSTAYIVFPKLTLTSNNIEVGTWLKASSITGGATPFQIGIITDPSDIESSFEPLYSSTLTTTTWTEIRMNTASTLQPLTSQTMICIALPAGLVRTLYIDDVAIHAIPTCIRPEDFTISNVTARTATFSWTTTNASQARIYVTEDYLYRRSMLRLYTVDATTNPFTITNLQPNTDYSFQIRGICSATDSSELNPTTLTAHTECVIADSALFVESFESLTTANTLPDCWQMDWWNKPTANTKAVPFTSSTLRSHTGSRSMSLQRQTAGSVAYLTTQQLPIDQPNRYTLSVWVYRQEASLFPAEGLKFWASTSPTDTTGATLLGSVPRHYLATPAESSANVWYNYEFPITTSGNLYIIVEGTSLNGDAIYFDDLQVEYTPSCFRVSNVGLGTPSYNSVPLTWTKGQNETSWIVSYTTNGVTYTTDTVVVQTQHAASLTDTITGLSPATTYTIEGTVTALCSPTSMSQPVQFSQTITTTCQALTFLPYSCGFESNELTTVTNPMPLCWQRYNDSQTSDGCYPLATTSTTYARTGSGYLKFMPVSSANADYGAHQVAVLPQINTSLYPINTLRIVLYASLSTTAAEQLIIGVMTDPTNFSTFVPVDSYLVATTNYLKVEKYFNNYTGSGSYIALMMRRTNNTFLSVNIDDIRVETAPTCADLPDDGVIVSDITSTSARLTVSDPTATNWSFAYGLKGTPLSACTLKDTTGTSIILNNLSPQTNYVVYARRNCTSDYGAWGPAVYFRTACGAATVPFTDDFESYTDGGLSGCYNVINSNDRSLNVFTEQSGAAGDMAFNHSTGGTKGLCSAFDVTSTSRVATSDDLTFTTLIHLDGGTNYELSAYAKSSSVSSAYNWNLDFVMGLSSSTIATFRTTSVTSSDWTKMTAYFTATTTGDYYIGFRTSPAASLGSYYPFLDDIMLREVTCIPPTSSNIATLTSNSATIGFTSSASQWEVLVWENDGSSGRDDACVVSQGSSAIYHDTLTTTQFTVGGLTPNTDYYYTIRSLCGSTPSDWMTTQTFRTRCTTHNVPYTEGFETSESVACWSSIGISGSISRNTTIRHSGTASMQISATSAVSPEFNVTSFTPYQLTGYAYSTTDSALLTVGVMTDPDDASSFDPLDTIVVTPASSWVELSTLFTLLNDPDHSAFLNARYIAINAGNNTVYIDDLNLDLIPSCAKPSNGSITNITGRSATIDWRENNTATQWSARAVQSNGRATTQVVTSHPLTLTNLTPATKYSVYVRSICSPTDTSAEYKLGEFTTACDYMNAPYNENFENQTIDVPPTCWDVSASTTSAVQRHPSYVWAVYSHNGNNSIRLYNAMTSSGDAIIETPEIILPAGNTSELRYDWSHQASSGALTVGIRRHGESSYTTIASHTQQGNSTDYTTPNFTTNTVGLQSYAGDTIQLRFYNYANWGSGALWIDNVKVRVLSSCSEIRAASVQSVDSTSALIAFSDTSSTHTQWQYAIGYTGFDPDYATPIDITSKMFTVSNLSPATDYDLYIRAVCTPGSDYSSWVQLSFRTDATPARLPYLCDFSNSAQNNEWTSLGSGANSFVFGNNGNATFGSGTHAMYVSNNNDYTYNLNSSSQSGMARLFHFDNSSYVIEFDYKCSGGETQSDFGRFYLVEASSDLMPSGSGLFRNMTWPSGLIPLDSNTFVCKVEGSKHVSEIIDFNGISGNYYLVFLWCNDNSLGAQYPLSIGNVNVYELNCLPVEDLTVSDITTTTADVSCFNTNVGASLRWAISTSSLITDSVRTGTSNVDNFTISNLSPSTEYHLFVRSECSNGYSSPWTSVALTTLCDAVTQFPYSEDFETVTFPPVCWTATTLTSVEEPGWGTVDGRWSQSTRNCRGTKGAQFDGNPGTSALLSSPLFHLSADREYHVSYWIMRSSSTWNTDEVKVYIGPNADSKDGATLIASYVVYGQNISSNGLVQYDVDLPAGLSGDYRVLFEAIDVTNGYIYLDDVTFSEYPPCRNLTTLPTITASTSTQATVSMNRGSRTMVEFGIAPGYPAQSTAITQTITSTDATATATFTGLTPATDYSIFARGICSAENDTTAWTVAVQLTTKTNDCFTPENLHISGIISDTSATIVWNAVPDVTTYQCILSGAAASDTTLVTTSSFTSTTLTPNTSYTLYVRGFCGLVDTTGWASITFSTLTTPATLPYVTGFEGSDDNGSWQRLNSGYVNNFIYGTDGAAHKSGNRGLYISADGHSYGQSVPTNSTPRYGVDIHGVTYATRTVYFPSSGTYGVTYDWKCDPLSSANVTYEAYGRAFLAPVTADLPVDSNAYARNLPAGSIALCDENLEGSSTWQHHYTIFTLDTACYMNVVFMYYAVNVNGYTSQSDASSTPLAIDNVTVSSITCLPPDNVVVTNITDTAALAIVSGANADTLEYAISTSSDESTISASSIVVQTEHAPSLTDTIHLSSLTPNTTYYLFVRQRCDSVTTSYWTSQTFTTTTTPAVTPYICDFEDSLDRTNWLFTYDKENRLTIGTATSFGGTHALYVTNDGHSFTYSDSIYAYAYASRRITLNAGMYDYSYDWQCLGEATNDGARVFLLPASVKLHAGSWMRGLSNTTVPANAIALDGGSLLYNQPAYTPFSGTFTLNDSDSYNIVVAWRNNSYTVYSPAFALDNLHITPVTCLPPTVTLLSVETTHASSSGTAMATILVSNANQGSSLVYGLSTTGDIEDIALLDTLVGARAPHLDTIQLSGLSASTTYTLFARSHCDSLDESYWSSTTFKTPCGTITSFPYTESFETVSATTSYVASKVNEICWSSLNAVKATPYYIITTSQHIDGAQSLQLTASATTPLVMLLPAMTDLNNLALTFYSKYQVLTQTKGTLTAGYVTNPADATTFVPLQTPTRSKSWTSNTVIFTNIPADARMAFRFADASTGGSSAYIDKIRVSELADGPTYNDTVCYNKPYSLHGFSIPAASISYGDNTFTRIQTTNAEGAKDTLYTAHIYKLQNINDTVYDTICGGQPYNRGLWTLANPTTRRYYHTFAGASACGCDSTVTLFLTVIPTSNILTDTICHGGSYLFGDTTLTTPGTYVRAYTAQYGCISHDTLTLTVLPDSIFDTATVCQYDLPYLWRGQSITTAGTHTLTVTGPHGCPQTALLDLTVIPTDSVMNVTICQGGSTTVVDTVLSTAGLHEFSRISPLGCYITYHVTVTVDAPVTEHVYDVACQGHPYYGYGVSGITVTQDTLVVITTRTIDGSCDSISNVHLHFVATSYSDTSATIAAGESFTWHDQTYNRAGDYTETLQSIDGCDSIVTLHLTVTGTGVEDTYDIGDVTIKIIPNPAPANTIATLYLETQGILENIEILSSTGTLIYNITPDTHPITLLTPPTPGIYYIRLTLTTGDTYVQKLIVN